jgi:uncharacterized membrane protein
MAAFFASTSLLAVGGALALMRAPEEAMAITAYLPLSEPTSRAVWELKVFGLAVILVYAFFKFAWTYRVFNYAAIMMGAVMHEEGSRERMLAQACGVTTFARLRPRSPRRRRCTAKRPPYAGFATQVQRGA